VILYLGERETFDYLSSLGIHAVFSNSLSNAEKVIVTEFSEDAIRIIKEALLINIPVLGILDGFQSVVSAFDGKCEEINCAEGRQEFAVIDINVPIFKDLETVIKICRGKPVGLLESSLPKDLDIISRSNEGDILAVSNLIAPEKHGNIYGINYYLASGLTPDAEKIINNFINL